MPLLYKGSYAYVDDATRTCTYPPPVTTSHRDEKMTKLVQNLYVHDFINSDYHRDLNKNYLRPKYVTKLWGGYFFCYFVPFRADGTGVIFGRYTNLLQSKNRKSF